MFDEEYDTVPEVEEKEGLEEDEDVPSPEDMTLLKELRKKREQSLAERPPLEIPVPGYDGLLVMKFVQIPWERANKIINKSQRAARKDPRKELEGAADLLVAACEGIYARLKPSDPLRRIADGFDQDLAERLGFQAARAREVVFGTFNNDFAVMSTMNDVFNWISEEAEENDDSGNS